MFDNLLLEEEQKSLICKFVEAVKKVPRDKRVKFIVSETFDGTEIIHPGLQKGEDKVYIGDVEALGRENLIAITYDSLGTSLFDVTPLGFKYYEEISKRISNKSHDINRINSFKHLLHEIIASKHNKSKAVLWHEISNRLPVGLTDSEIENAITDLVKKYYIIFESGPSIRETRFIAGPSFSVWSDESEGQNASYEGKMPIDKKRVFVVHGRNLAIRDAIFQFLRAIGLNPIEFIQAIASTGKAAPFVGETIEAGIFQAQAVVVLLTGDDEARLRSQFLNRNDSDYNYESKLTPQARPNVLFEAGMAFGRHPERTVLVEIGHIKKFSDIGGRHIIRLDNSGARRYEFAQRLLNAGCSVDLNGIDWNTAGNFEIVNDTSYINNSERNELGGKSEITQEEINILQLLSKYENNQVDLLEDINIHRDLKIPLTKVRHYLDMLLYLDYVRDSLVMGCPPKYGLTAKGRDFLVKRNLI